RSSARWSCLRRSTARPRSCSAAPVWTSATTMRSSSWVEQARNMTRAPGGALVVSVADSDAVGALRHHFRQQGHAELDRCRKAHPTGFQRAVGVLRLVDAHLLKNGP